MRTSVFVIPLSVFLLPFLSLVASSPGFPRLPTLCVYGMLNPFKCKDDPNLPVIEHVSQQLLNRMKLMSQYAAAAYCPENSNSSLTDIKCHTHNCPLVEERHVQSLVEFEDMVAADSTGYVSIDDRGKDIVVAFRGSKSRANWHQDIRIIRISTGWCDECNSHHGFWESWMQVRDLILEPVKRAMKLHPDYNLVVVGHSLGAAVATLAAGEIRQIDETFRKKTELVSANSFLTSMATL